MNHPNSEEWMARLYGELGEERRVALDAHLGECAECRTRVAEWRAAMRQLDDWKLPRRSRRPAWSPALVRWGLAAAVVLGLGLAWSAAMSARVAASTRLKESLVPALRQELRGDLQAALAGDAAALTNEFRRELRGELNRWASANLAAARADAQQFLADYAAAARVERETDREATLALVQKSDQQRRTDYARLRQDLETVALVAEGRFQAAQHQIGQLAAYNQPTTRDDGGIIPASHTPKKGN